MLIRICLIASIIAVAPLAADAQKRDRQRYQSPSGPTLSPYLLYNSLPTGPLDNYHSFVRPTLRLESTIRSQNQQLRNLNREVGRVESAQTTQIRESELSPTGHGAAFLNFSHFFPASSSRGR